ncbi:sodium:solute symporter family transporter [Streptomyces zingiberis]|uniref:Cation acetate symporter n=1 Tax=Streptomyces zingiberis TaxID=2053010 RepID=A0ABX1BW61_9ACTN|nr:cation acetate symporter [Streptomyces zingiberis]NJQ00513.1 cation acetate symporter [Streptomyces zingiberis]
MTTGFTGDHFTTVLFFLLFVLGCLLLSMWSSQDLGEGADAFHSGGSGNGPVRQSLALSGDFVSIAGVLYIVGTVAVAGFDGIAVVIATALSPLLFSRVLAGRLPIEHTRSFGDVLAHRLPGPAARRLAAVAALVASVPLLVAQLGPLGEITAALMGFPGRLGETACTVVLGLIILTCASIGGARGATLLQAGMAVSFVFMGPLLAALVMGQFGWSTGELAKAAEKGSQAGDSYFSFGHLFGGGTTGAVDTVSLVLTILLGAAFLPHFIPRLTTSRGPSEARRAAGWTAGTVALLCFSAIFLGYGIQALIGADGINAAGPRGGNNLLLLADALDGGDQGPGMVLTFIASATFLTVMASASVMLLVSSAAIVHDLGAGRAEKARRRVRIHDGVRARLALLAAGAAAIALAVFGRDANPQFWLILSYTVAASSVLPALCVGLLWRRYTVSGLRWAVVGGISVTVLLMFFSPAISGAPDAVFPGADWQVFPLSSPGLVSIPVGFLLAWLGNRREAPEPQPEPDDGEWRPGGRTRQPVG